MTEQAKNIVVLGAGESGVGAAMLAKRKGFDVFVSDRGVIKAHYQKELEEAGIGYEGEKHTEERILQADEVIKSPGIPDTVPLVRALVAKGTPVISEIEFAARYTDAMLVGITGSNGKTTTATLMHHLLSQSGLDARLAGNVGIGFARSVAELDDPAIYVLELSSFQLDGIRLFRPSLAVLLNITPDHLDRYNYELDNYIDSKLRITMNQGATDHFWFFAEDENIQQGMNRNEVLAEQHPVGLEAMHGRRIQVGEDWFDLSTTALQGKHNALNALFAAGIALHLGMSHLAVQEALNSFVPVPHRLEKVRVLKGVTFINDSKATNVDAVQYALDAVDQPIVWIAGGTDKGNEYDPLLALAKEKVKALICLGVDNEKLKTTFSELIPVIREVQSAKDAVEMSLQLSERGDTVLLSPACASFDLFRNYIDRGDQFRNAVLQLDSGH